MKVSNIPGLGSFGRYIDDVDFDNLTSEEWLEIGKLHLNGLVTILRNVNITKDQFNSRMREFGPFKGTRNSRAHFKIKYGEDFDPKDENAFDRFNVTPQDRSYLSYKKHFVEQTEGGNFLTRITGRKDEDGNALGVFSSGELHWHSNESSEITFSPEVALLGGQHMIGSTTGFVQSVDAYNDFSESFRSELDEMVVIHNYIPGGINDIELTDKEMGNMLQMEFCYHPDAEVPLVLTSPGGHKGLHYTTNTATGIKGMSQTESDKIFKIIDNQVFTDKYIYDHKYKTDNELLLFDNSVTLHRRKDPGHPDRVAYRIQYDPSNLLDSPWYPFDHLPEYAEKYKVQTHELIQTLNIQDFKLP
jgi:alpha-ketoglutarate-dependent taurine dioxygenase